FPASDGTLLNLSGVNSPTPIYGCSFDNTSDVSPAYNVRADDSTEKVQFRDYSGHLASDPETAESNDDDAYEKIYWGVNETEVGVKVVGECSDAFEDDLVITYQEGGEQVNLQIGGQETRENRTIWPDYSTDIEWQVELTASGEDRERWRLDYEANVTETVEEGGNSWIKEYYHQYQITIQTTGGYLDSNNFTRLYWSNASYENSTEIYDNIDPDVEEWINCGSAFNVTKEVEGPDEPRNVTYVCDDNETETTGDFFTHEFLFHAEFPPDVSITGPEGASQFGWSVSGGMDLNNSTYDDIAVGAPGYDDRGRMYVFYSEGDWEIGDEIHAGYHADLVREGESTGDRFGHALSGPGDVLGNGHRSVAVGAPYHDSDKGRTYLYEMGEWPTMDLTFESDGGKKLLGSISIDIEQGARWYNETIETEEDHFTLESGDSVNMTVELKGDYDHGDVDLYYDSEEYDSHYEMSLEYELGDARTEWVKTYKGDQSTESWMADYQKGDTVNITANITAKEGDVTNISSANVTIRTAGGELIQQETEMQFTGEEGADWKRFYKEFDTSTWSEGRYKAVVHGIDKDGVSDERLGETDDKTVWFRVVGS
ncbi:MAG: hypothetical protein KGY76_07060, partial [Candidatus Thermoplasmatota archaeon]|nr:hypothetical protein [Candidatus Thermoplasmatota archaeon]